MKPTTTDAVLDLMDAAFASAALGAALELGLFWWLEARPRDGQEVARALGIPPIRCQYWLQLLCDTGLLEQGPEGYRPSATARTAILGIYSQDSWALLAEEARERLGGLRDLAIHLGEPGSVWDVLGLTPPSYLTRMTESAERARRFTRMLYEIHGSLAEELADLLDLRGVERLMDLGGGSGVFSLALARRHPRLTAVVVDIANVCAAGREIAAENALEHRVTYHPADFLVDELPTGFDLVLECDVDVYGEALFRKVLAALRPGGRFVIIDQLAPAEGIAPPSRRHWAFEGSLRNPDFAFPTAAQIRDQLRSAGFRRVSESPPPSASEASTRFRDGMVVIEALR